MIDRLHHRLLRAYPRAFRQQFAAEIQQTFEARLAAARARGRFVAAAFALFACADTIVSGLIERMIHHRPFQAHRETPMTWTGLLMDIRFALRLMRRSPMVTAASMLALGLGIGAAGAIFAAVNAVLLRPLPYAHADSLVMVWSDNTREGNHRNPVAPADYLDLQRENQSLEGLEALQSFLAPDVFQDGPTPDVVQTSTVTDGMFALLGRDAIIGRAFHRGDRGVVILSHGFWLRRYGGNRDIIGRSVNVSGAPGTVIGVMPADFVFPYRTMLGPSGFVRAQAADVWLPMQFLGRFFQNPDGSITRQARFLGLVGRIKRDASVEAARADLVRVAAALADRYDSSNRGWSATVLPLHDQTVSSVRPALALVAAGVGVLLLMTCANVANVLLARALGRSRELAVRRALGASSWRLVRLNVLESLLLSAGGGVVGAGFLYAGIRLVVALAPADTPRVAEIGGDLTVFFFTLAIVTAVGIVVGLLPAASARAATQPALADGARTTTGPQRRRLRSSLVVVEIALAVLLSVGGMLLMRSFASVLHVDPGFRPEQLLTFQINIPNRYTTPDARRAYYDDLFFRLEQVPGVIKAGGTTRLPLGSTNVSTSLGIEGHDLTPAALPEVEFRRASHDYFAAMGIPVLAGRTFTADDGPNAPGVCVVNRTLAAKLLPGEDPIGKHVRIGPSTTAIWITIIGVIGDIRHGSLEEVPKPELYISARQNPPVSPFIVLRTAGDPSGVSDAVRTAVRSLDAATPIYDLKAMTEIRREVVAERRFALTLVGVFCGFALVLAALGVYGAMVLAVSERTKEVGLRLALGAPPMQVLRLVLRQAVMLGGLGVGIGVAASVATMPLVRGQLYGVGPFDLTSFALVAVVLFAVAIMAALIPARRAMRVDPIATLREG
jgi:putative ABC transport system permease protein